MAFLWDFDVIMVIYWEFTGIFWEIEGSILDREPGVASGKDTLVKLWLIDDIICSE